MTTLKNQIDQLNWTRIATDLDSEGYALLPGVLSAAQADALTSQLSDQLSQIKELTVCNMSLARCEPDHGRLHFFEDQLPEVLAILRKQFYCHLAPIANRWNKILQLDYRYPETLDRFLQANHDAGQHRKLSHLHRLQETDYIALHQRNDGQLVFPLQAVLLLSEPGQDFRGGELVMTEQRPRMQSRPIVLSMRQVDVAILSTGQRPFKGSHGFYQVNMKHAISRVRSGQRIGLELFFHHAPGDNQRNTHEQGSLLDTDRT
ncbi:2OG-Fe(II) oxygenase [Advenella kashmirensis]